MNIVVIGGGLIGVQTAYFLNEAGHHVTIIEQREAVGLETSFANGGLITPSHAAPWNAPGIFSTLIKSLVNKGGDIYVKPGQLHLYLNWGFKFVRNSTKAKFRATIEKNAKLAHFSLNQFHKICDIVQPKFSHDAKGTLMVYRKSSSFNQAIDDIALLGQNSIEHQILNSEQLVKFEPSLAVAGKKIAGATYFPADEHGDAHQYTQQLAKYLQSNGVKFRYGEIVKSFNQKNSKIQSIVTDKEIVEADTFIVANGLSSAALMSKIGQKLPIKPVKGYSITYDATGWTNLPSLPLVDNDAHIALTPLKERLRIVGSAEFSGFNTDLDVARLENLKQTAIFLYPEMEEFILTQTPLLEWAGLRPMTPDCLPIVGKLGADNLFINAGHGYLGWTTGAGTAKIIADLVDGRQTEINASMFENSRFNIFI